MKWYERERINSRIAMTVAQRRIAKEMHERAQRLRDESESLTIHEAVHIAAFQMGLQEPDSEESNADGDSETSE